MAIKERPEKQTPPITYKASDRLIDEKDTLIEIIKTWKAITGMDPGFRTQPTQAGEKPEAVEGVKALPDLVLILFKIFYLRQKPVS